MKPKEKISKLESCIAIQDGIKSFEKKIALYTEYLDGFAGTFKELRIKYANNIDTYMRCISRLESRYNKIIKELYEQL